MTARQPVARISFVFDRACGPSRGNRAWRSGTILPLRAPPFLLCRPNRVIRRRVPWRGVPLPVRPGPSRPDRASGPSLVSPDGAPGVLPFAGLLPRTGGRAIKASRLLRSRHFCRSGPTCRSCRSSASIYFRRGDPLAGGNLIKRANEPGMMPASTSGLRLPSAIRFHDPSGQRTDPALGFASCRVGGHVTAHPVGLNGRSTIDRRRPTHADHQSPEIRRTEPIPIAHPYPLLGLRRPSRTGCTASCSPDVSLICGDAAPPSPALQRFDEADAWPGPDQPCGRSGSAPCLRFCTVREEMIVTS
jgi:hypothetical protein